ncbi:MAG: pilus assembly protein PilF, partial [Magnetococcales bacterium]|nr:pilus assembly protein PilF [Magnetococcales bacterium]
LLLPEQGFGDQLQFCRYVPRLKSLGVGRLTMVCAAPLAPLFRLLPGVDRVVTQETTPLDPPHDFWVLPLSLPGLLGSTQATLPATLPYLNAPLERLSRWASRDWPRGLRVGLLWKGNPAFSHDATRSLAGLETLAPLWEVPGVGFVSLQKGEGEEEANHPPPGQPLLPLGAEIEDFGDTAAIIHHLDLVICCDSAVAHLAGALGKPCWLLVSHNADWRWMRERADSPWYPGVLRLFRQSRPDDWTEVVERLREALECLINSR